MQLEHAEHTLETIRTLMERSQRYEHVSGLAGLVAGGAVGAGGVALAGGWLPFGERGNFAVVWGTVFAVALTVQCRLTFTRARQRGEPVWSRQARTVTLALLPSFLAGVVVTALFARLDRLDVLPGVWLLLYGCGALATSFFAPRSIGWLGGVCLGLGALSLLLTPAQPVLTMVVGFGLTHIVYGSAVLVAELRQNRDHTFWSEVQRLADSDRIG